MNNLVNAIGSWDWAFISTLLLPNVCAKIAAIPPPDNAFDPDILLWLPSQEGNFNVSSAHPSIAYLNGTSYEPIYRSIWKWCGLEQIKLFLWLMGNDPLYKNAFCHYQHLS